MEKYCERCNVTFKKLVTDSRSYWAKKKYCSIACAGFQKGHKHSEEYIKRLRGLVGTKNPRYRGRRSLTAQGYLSMTHPIRGGRILEHRYVMEQKLGRSLKSFEHVHHKDGDKTNNNIANLELVDNVEHNRQHTRKRWENPSKPFRSNLVGANHG